MGQTSGIFPQLKEGKTVGKSKPTGGHKKISGSMGTGKKSTPCNY